MSDTKTIKITEDQAKQFAREIPTNAIGLYIADHIDEFEKWKKQGGFN